MVYAIIGRHGLIGSTLAKKLEALGHSISSNPSPECDAIIHLASPTHVEFDKNTDYHMGEALASFQFLLPYCKQHDILFIYASSALVYETEKKSSFRNCKMILEQMAEAYGGRTLGLRIFPVYGNGENRTVISQWCRKMKAGFPISVNGDGTQTRDFIHVDDVVDNIISAIEYSRTGIMDVGPGNPVSFNEIIKEIQSQLDIEGVIKYNPAPVGYSKGIQCHNPVPCKVSLEEGIRRIINE